MNHLALNNLVTSQQKTMEVKFGISEIYPIEKHNDIVITDDDEEDTSKHLEVPKEEIDSSTKPKSLLTALIQESYDPPHIMMKAKSPPKKHVTLKIPDKKPVLAETEIGPVPQQPKSPKPVSPPPCSEAMGTTVSQKCYMVVLLQIRTFTKSWHFQNVHF